MTQIQASGRNGPVVQQSPPTLSTASVRKAKRARREWGESPLFRTITPTLAVLSAVVAWQVATKAGNIAPTVLPSPTRVAEAAWTDREALWQNTIPTLQVTVVGLVVSVVISAILATLLSFVPLLRNATLPLLIVAQSIPIIVLAPLFVIWFGFGLGPKIGLIVITTTLPMTISLLQGFLSADPDAATLMKSLGAGRVKVFLRLQVPSSLPYFFTGLRVIASFAVLAAIFAETVGAVNGLGIYMATQKNMLRTDLVLAAAVISIAVSLLLFSLTYLLETLAMPWERRRKAMRSE